MTFFKIKLLLLIVLIIQLSEARRSNLINTLRSTISFKGNSTIWAVLVAGSNGYDNYRHQADVCHAYQILKIGGLKDENIIVFMYDDIANDPLNPQPGVIINRPKGPNVYVGVPKDYTGESATADNFYAVLLGNSSAVKGGSGKVVASKPNDKIFVFYSDHGGFGILGMPTGNFILANEFNQVLKTKHASGTYDKMVIYLESCESGSIFEDLLPENLNIYVTTAANADENSWATYCPPLNGPSPTGLLDTCLGDLYSVSWMEDSESEDSRLETLEQQYLKVKKRTANNNYSEGSHVMQYGTLQIGNETVSDYQGSTMKITADPFQSPDSMVVVDQRDADLYAMRQRYNRLAEETLQKDELLKKINEITAYRAHLDSSVDMIKHNLLGNGNGPTRSKGSALLDDWECFKFMIRTFETYCGSLTQYGMKHTRTFANICNNGTTKKAMDEATRKACSSHKMGQWNPAIVGYSV